MIGGFPDLYPDELLYSGMARYADWMVYPTKSALRRDLFGAAHVHSSLDLPRRLDYLVAALPPGHRYTADRLIDQHTLWPFYAPFLPPERADRVRQAMHNDSRANLYALIGLLPGKTHFFQTLRFCPLCADGDRQRYGEVYWHRLAHVPGVVVCPIHQVWLEDTQTFFGAIGHYPLFMSAEQAICVTSPRPLDLADPAQRILLAFARDAAWLLDQAIPGTDREALRRRYVACLFERDLSTYTGRVRLPELVEAFQHTYPEALLHQLHGELRLHLSAHWLTDLVRPSVRRASHPLHHLLLIHFLGHTLESFFQLPADRKPFGDGPWPCLNPAADHYRQACLSVLEVKSRRQDGRPVGTFTCECGFSYSRIGPDSSPDDQFHYAYINTTGPVWDDLLRRLWYDPAVNTNAMERLLNTSWATLRKHAVRLNLSFPPPGFRLTRALSPLPAPSSTPRSPKQHDPTPFREFWRAVIEQHPDAGTTELRHQFPYEYDWLFNYDREWFDAHRPSPKPYVHRQLHMDWAARDSRVATEIAAIAQQLKNTPSKPFRVTRSLLASAAGVKGLIQERTDQLPLTLQALRDFEETYEDCAIRRIWWCVEQFRREGKCPTRYQLAIRASVNAKSGPGPDPRVQTALQDALQSFQRGDVL